MEGKRLLTARDVLYVFFKSRVVITTVFLTAIVLSLIYCIVTPPVYRAETKLLVKLGKSQVSSMEQLRPEVYNVVFQERTQNIRNEMELLKGQYLTEKVIGRLRDRIEPLKTDESIIGGIVEGVKTVVGTIFSWLGLSSRPVGTDKGTVLTFLNALHVTYLEDTDMISVAFDWTDPKFAALAANVYADEYVTQHMLVYESQKSYRFYIDQIATFEKKLRDAEDRLQNFLSSTNIANIVLQKDLLLRNLADLQNQLNTTAIDLSQSQTKVNKIREMARSTGWVETPEMGSHMADKQAYLRSIDEAYFRLRAERERLLKFYTTRSDEIRAIDSQLAGFRKQKTESLINIATLDLSLLQNKKASLEREIEGEKKKIEDINVKTVTLKQLERERDLTEQNYQVYKKKAEELRISDDLDSRRISDVKIAMPAIPPLAAAYPKKGLIVIISAIVGLALGFGFSAVSEFFNHTFRDHEDVFDVLGVPLLLSVPFLAGSEPQPFRHGAMRRGFEGVRRTFSRDDQAPPVASHGSFAPGGVNVMVFFVMLMVGIGGYMLYAHKGAEGVNDAILAAQTASHRPASAQQVSLAAVYPVRLFHDVPAKPAEDAKGAAAPKQGELPLLSDDLEKRRLVLEKRRAEIEAELEQVRSEMEVRLKRLQYQNSPFGGGAAAQGEAAFRPGNGNTDSHSGTSK
jgi:uncharacterized protein involved in exopolysaccharide biosynthesis